MSSSEESFIEINFIKEGAFFWDAQEKSIPAS